MPISDKELVALFKSLQQADQQHEERLVELNRLETRINELRAEIEDNTSVLEAQKELWMKMVERNLQMLWYGDSVAVLTGSRVKIYSGLKSLNLEEEDGTVV